jgi:ornithine cyclodeaminase/alanine dehydrogenase-like protein (mu-crystallin family)
LPPGITARIEDLPQCVAGQAPARPPSGPTVFLSHGLAIEDAVAARLAFDAAVEKGLGHDLAM